MLTLTRRKFRQEWLILRRKKFDIHIKLDIDFSQLADSFLIKGKVWIVHLSFYGFHIKHNILIKLYFYHFENWQIFEKKKTDLKIGGVAAEHVLSSGPIPEMQISQSSEFIHLKIFLFFFVYFPPFLVKNENFAEFEKFGNFIEHTLRDANLIKDQTVFFAY